MKCSYQDGVLMLSNQRLTRTIRFENGVPMHSTLQAGGSAWITGNRPVFSLRGLDLQGATVTPTPRGVQLEKDGLALRWEFSMPEDLPFIESTLYVKGTLPEVTARGDSARGDSATASGVESAARRESIQADYADSFGSRSESLTLCAVELRDVTDRTNTLVRTTENTVYFRGGLACDGHIFFATDHMTGEDCIAVKLAPGRAGHYHRDSADLIAEGTCMYLCAPGLDAAAVNPQEWTPAYTCALGLCPTPERERTLRAWYRSAMPAAPRYIMSNTWGDRNQDKCICEEFILREIDRAAELGVDVVQIDDGWEQGITANSALHSGGVWNGGYRAADKDFWAVNKTKFPRGLGPVAAHAAARGVELGLWFSPDAANDYENYRLDAATLLDLYQTYGVRHFKLDGIATCSRRAELNLMEMLSLLQAQTGGRMVFNMDITAGQRPGYLVRRDHGDLFVENRYTDWGNYYPHATLHNLWQLARYIPSERLQFEVLNLRRNKEKYTSCLGPDNYTMDYVFASVMAAKPLIWMEMTGLGAQDAACLREIIAVYKKYREDFLDAEPIGDCPNGYALTGFRIHGKQQDYLILLRENDPPVGEAAGTFPVQLERLLATNDPDAGLSPATLTKPRSYLFGIVQK